MDFYVKILVKYRKIVNLFSINCLISQKNKQTFVFLLQFIIIY